MSLGKVFFSVRFSCHFFACLFSYIHEFVANICRSERNFFYLGDGQSVGRIVLFSSSGLQKCKEIRSIRRSKNLKYKNVTPPEQIGGLEGYHRTCYRHFTALSKEYTKADTAQNSANYTTRSQSNILSATSTGVLSKVWIFCEKEDKIHKNRKQSLVNVKTPNFENKIKAYASLLQDNKMLARIGDIDFVAKEITYHAICRTRY